MIFAIIHWIYFFIVKVSMVQPMIDGLGFFLAKIWWFMYIALKHHIWR